MGKAVCEVRGIELSGRPAFATYLGVHLYYLGGGVGRRVGLLTDWVSARIGHPHHQVIEGELAGVERADGERGGDGEVIAAAESTLGRARDQAARLAEAGEPRRPATVRDLSSAATRPVATASCRAP